MIGTQENAQVAASYGRRRSYDLQDGWSLLCSGSSRCAYLGPDGVVYKVGRAMYNRTEHARMQDFRNGPVHEYFRFPDTTLYEVVSPPDVYGHEYNVIAMEYVPDTTHENLLPQDAAMEAWSVFELDDMFWANWRVHQIDGKVLVTIIDAGEC